MGNSGTTYPCRQDRRSSTESKSAGSAQRYLLYSVRWLHLAFLLPHDFPAWKTVYHYFCLWRQVGVWQQMNQVLREKVRSYVERQPTPSAAIVDSQSVKTTEVAQAVGYDGAKLVKGHKRHVLVDTLGLLLQVVVGAANVSEKAGAMLILEKIALIQSTITISCLMWVRKV